MYHNILGNDNTNTIIVIIYTIVKINLMFMNG